MYQLVHPTLLQSIAFRLWQIYLPKIVRQCGQLSSSPPGSAAHLWWAVMIGWVIWVMKFNWNVKKAPEVIKKWKTHFYTTFNFWWLAKWSKQQKSTEMQKRSPKSSKNEMLVFGLRSTSGDQPSNESRPKCDKSPPKSSKNEILIFILHSTSDDWPCNPSDESWSKCEKIKCCLLGSSIVSVRVFCCFSLGLLLFQLGSSLSPPQMER